MRTEAHDKKAGALRSCFCVLCEVEIIANLDETCTALHHSPQIYATHLTLRADKTVQIVLSSMIIDQNG
jgi:hypothetical protein